MNLSFQKLFFAIATVFALFAIMIFAKSILIPLAFAMLISFILFPLAKRFEAWGMNRILATFLAIFVAILIIAGGLFMFSTQIYGMASDFSQFQDKILRVFADVTLFINRNVTFIENLDEDELANQLKNWFNSSAGSLAQTTFSTTASFFTGLVSTLIFTFLILIYRNGLTHAMSRFYPAEKRDRAVGMFKSIQQVGQKYLFGMVLIIIILGVVNSTGLWIIGIDHPFLFGFLAAILAIVPYVGTTLGAAIPVMYALFSYDSLWMPVAVTLLFWGVQLIESNFLSPKVVGGSLKINALSAILSIIVGASVWGVAGMILFLPLTAILKVICSEYDQLKPIALLIGEENYKDDKGGSSRMSNWGKKIKGWFKGSG